MAELWGSWDEGRWSRQAFTLHCLCVLCLGCHSNRSAINIIKYYDKVASLHENIIICVCNKCDGNLEIGSITEEVST